jgi:hypothetical protein
MRNAPTSPATSSPLNTPRPANAAELEQLAGWLRDQGHDADDAAETAANAYVAVYDSYMTGGPGFCGKLMSVVWDGSPSFFDVFTSDGGKLVREDRDYDEKECVGCGGKNGMLCYGCWRSWSGKTAEKPSPTKPAAHTPGPWRLRTPGDGTPNAVRYWVDAPGGYPIADIKVHGQEETVADARLIAAAPDLLEACHALFQALIDTDISETPDDDLDEPDREAIDLYQAAVAKAEGSPEQQ